MLEVISNVFVLLIGAAIVSEVVETLRILKSESDRFQTPLPLVPEKIYDPFIPIGYVNTEVGPVPFEQFGISEKWVSDQVIPLSLDKNTS